MTATVSPSQAAELVRSTDTLGVPLGPGVPGAFMHALGAREHFDQLDVFGALMPDLFEVLSRPGVRYRSGFYGPAERFWLAQGADIEFVPADFRRFAPILDALTPRVMATAASMPDESGRVSLSLHAGATVDQLQRAADDPDRLCVVEVSPHFPRTLGVEPDHPHSIAIDDIDVLVESDAEPFVLTEVEADSAQRAIAHRAAEFVPDGATLQTGIGGIPNSVASVLATGSKGNFGIHSEMFTSGLMRLCESGKVTNDRKGIFDGFSVTTFAAGSRELYDWLDGNDAVRFLPVEVVNSPESISRNAQMITINGALSVDLSGQVVADTKGGGQFSGIGGHEDFIAGAGIESSDRSLVCLPSTTKVGEVAVSRIVGIPAEGTVVTTPRHQVDVVITEHGAAELAGLTVRERARALAEISDPSVRESLLETAEVWPTDR